MNRREVLRTCAMAPIMPLGIAAASKVREEKTPGLTQWFRYGGGRNRYGDQWLPYDPEWFHGDKSGVLPSLYMKGTPWVFVLVPEVLCVVRHKMRDHTRLAFRHPNERSTTPPNRLLFPQEIERILWERRRNWIYRVTVEEDESEYDAERPINSYLTPLNIYEFFGNPLKAWVEKDSRPRGKWAYS